MKVAIFLAPLLLFTGTAAMASPPDGPKPDNPNRDWRPADTREDRGKIKDYPDNRPAPGPSDPEVKPDNPYRDPHPTDPKTGG